MDLEDKFLDAAYLETRVRDLKEIKRGDLDFFIEKSCNAPKSKSLYIIFCKGGWNAATLRVSDHIVNTTQVQFIVTEGDILKKKKKEEFARLLEKVVGLAKKHLLKKALHDIGENK